MFQPSWNHPECSVLTVKELTVSHYAPGPKESVWFEYQRVSTPFVRATYHRHLALPWRRLPKLRRIRRTCTLICKANTCFVLLPSSEILGSFGEEALQVVSELGGLLRSTTGDAREKTWLIQRISIAIQRGNAESLLATIPPTYRTIDDFYSV
jgi:hypothetical protein